MSGFSVHPSNGRAASRGRRLAAFVGNAVLLAIIVALFVPSADAAPPTEFGSGGSGAGEFLEPHGIAVEQQSGDIYVVDRNNARVDKFGPEGEFLLAWGWGVADNSQELQICTSFCAPGREGPGAGELQFPSGIAVDNDPASVSYSDVYVGDRQNGRVQKFGPDGEFLLMLGGEVNATTHANLCLAGEACQAGVEGTGPGFFEALGEHSVAVGPDGSLYIGDTDRVQKFDPAGVLQEQIAFTGAGIVNELTVDSAGDLYVGGTEPSFAGIHKYDVSTAPPTELGAPRDASGAPTAIAVDPEAGGQLFIDDGTNDESGHHLLGFTAGGKQVSSFDSDKEGGSRGIAFSAPADGLFVLNSNTSEAAVRFVKPPASGPLVLLGSESADEITTGGATLHAAINPEGGTEASYSFQYGITTAYGQSSPIPPATLTGGAFEDQQVSSALANLQTRTTYHYRVVATNAAAETTLGTDREFTTLPPVSILAESVSQISATTATLEAELNPNGLAGEYHFEYGLSTAYGSTVPSPDASAGAGTTPVAVSVAIEGLEPGLTYHYRIVAHSALGLVEGADRTFTAQTALASLLPDDREWELVSPPDKHGSPLEAMAEEGDVIQAGRSGEAITYGAKGPTNSNPAGSRSTAFAQVLSRRGRTGWTSENAVTPNETVSGIFFGVLSEYKLFSQDLAIGAVESEGATPLSPYTSEKTPYLRLSDGEFEPLVVGCPAAPAPCPAAVAAHANVPRGTVFGGIEEEVGHFGENRVRFIAATPDFTHVVLSSPATLTSDSVVSPAGERSSLYEWTAGQLALVSILPDNAPATSADLASSLGHRNYVIRNAVSDDGDRLVFEAEDDNGNRNLFLRDMQVGETVQLDAPVEGVPPPSRGAVHPLFQGASADGSHVFFTDETVLTPNSRATDNSPDLYMCTMSVVAGKLKCELRDLTVPARAGERASVQGVTAIAEDGGRIVFAANGVLANGAQRGDCLPNTSGEPAPATNRCNFYSYDLSTGDTHLVAILSGRDAPDWELLGEQDLGGVTARLSPNGRFLAFMSQLPLTGYDNRDAKSGERDEEVFRYDAEADGGQGKTVCVSCNPTGARPVGVFDRHLFPGLLIDRPQVWGQQWLAASIPGWTRTEVKYADYQSRYLSNSGRLFFNAAGALVPQDANGVEDVYEYEAPRGPDQPASNDCAIGAAGYSPSAAGCVRLISSGTSPEESAFLDASESGDDVFFLTASKLTSQDIDGALDVYDAHACSAGSPCIEPPPPASPSCSGEACQPQGSPPGEPVSQTSTFAGPANPKARCAKGKVSKGGKCVKKTKKNKHKKGKHKKSNKHKGKKQKRNRTNTDRGGAK